MMGSLVITLSAYIKRNYVMEYLIVPTEVMRSTAVRKGIVQWELNSKVVYIILQSIKVN